MISRQTCVFVLIGLIVISSANAAPPLNKVAFTTSQAGPGDMSAWPQAADGLTGLAAADSICQHFASEAGLNNPSGFVAWLSDSTDDAYCRLAGFSGKRTDDCDQLSLPTDAGPWVRTDGMPFAGTLTELTQYEGLVYTPLILDENGEKFVENSIWVATGWYGELKSGSGHCTNWTGVNDGFVTTGTHEGTPRSWTTSGGINNNCAGELRMFCFETGAGSPLTLPAAKLSDIAFITSEKGSPNFSTWDAADDGKSGIEAADSICNNLASDAGLPHVGHYKAWLSDATTDARDRFSTTGGWLRPDNLPIAENMADLLDRELFTTINVDETGDHENSYYVWTGTFFNGESSGLHCNSWTDATDSFMGSSGFASRVDAWSGGPGWDCDFDPLAIYCMSDADPENIHKDGFEGSD